jgi:hypothetical protein
MSTSAPKVTLPRKIEGRVVSILSTNETGRLGFRSTPVDRLSVDLEGIVGNRHRGWTRPADARVPYLKRGTTIRNERHVSIVSTEDLAEIARRLDVPQIDPRWIGANIVVSGIPNFSYLPRGTHLFVGDAAILIVTDQNAPCSIAGESIAGFVPGREDIKLAFAKRAEGLRGVVCSVEHPGTITADSAVTARLPAQWIYGEV